MALFVLLFTLAVAVLAPWLGVDSSDARSEDARPEFGRWPAAPVAGRPRKQ
ncbi:MAG: hypothetical protein ABI468_11185 [Candidatus Nanopelagicales bacterium]